VVAVEEKHVVTCFLEHDKKIPLFRRSERVGTYRGRWAGISGYLEKGQIPYEQALKEIREETGLSEEDVRLLKEGEPLEAIDEEMGRKWIVHPYRFQVIKPEKIAIDWEHSELRWIAPGDISRYDTVPKLLETWQRVSKYEP
jgi:8-oxo-dGTP pyrophosphatase MutT (NUDIX family)